MVRILIVDDQPVFRHQLRRLLVRAGLAVVGEAGDIPEAEERVRALQPDLVVLDVALPGISGLEGVTRLKDLAPAIRIILVSAYKDHASLLHAAALRVGAETFVLKDDLELSLVEAWKSPPPAR